VAAAVPDPQDTVGAVSEALAEECHAALVFGCTGAAPLRPPRKSSKINAAL